MENPASARNPTATPTISLTSIVLYAPGIDDGPCTGFEPVTFQTFLMLLIAAGPREYNAPNRISPARAMPMVRPLGEYSDSAVRIIQRSASAPNHLSTSSGMADMPPPELPLLPRLGLVAEPLSMF